MASNLSQEPHQAHIQSHHHNLLAHGQPNMGNANTGNQISQSIRHDKSASNQEQHFVFGQQFSINAHQASNTHQQVQQQHHNDNNSSNSQMAQSSATPATSSSTSIPNLFDNSSLNQRLVPITFGQQSLASASSSLTDTLGLTATTHGHQLMILQQQQQQQQHNQALHFPMSNSSINDTNFNAAAFLQHQSVANIGVSGSSSHQSIASASNTTSSASTSANTTFPQIHLQNHQLHHHVVSTHNLDNISFASNASKVILDQTTRNDLLKMHTGSADMQTSFENFSNSANPLCQISNYANGSVPMNGGDSVLISNNSLIREINNNVGPSNPTYSGFVPCLDAKARNGSQESEISGADLFLANNRRSSNPVNGEINLNFASSNNLIGPCKSGVQASSVVNGSGVPTSCHGQNSKSKNHVKRDDKVTSRRSHSESPRRIFACPNCKKEFTEKFNMKRHMQIHAPSRPKFVCNECSKSFAWKDNFIRHRKAAHTNGNIINSLQPCPIN